MLLDLEWKVGDDGEVEEEDDEEDEEDDDEQGDY